MHPDQKNYKVQRNRQTPGQSVRIPVYKQLNVGKAVLCTGLKAARAAAMHAYTVATGVKVLGAGVKAPHAAYEVLHAGLQVQQAGLEVLQSGLKAGQGMGHRTMHPPMS